MTIYKGLFRAKSLLLIVFMLGSLSGCLDEAKTNTDAVSYTPEKRALGVIAGEGADFSPGDQVNLTGRLTGTLTNETVLWEQIEGTKIEGITDWKKPTLSFKAPVVSGIEAFKFQISARNAAGAIINDADGKPLVDQVTINIFDKAVLVTLQVEDTNFASLIGATLVGQGDSNYINGAVGTHTADITPGTKVSYKIPSGSKVGDKTLKTGFYTLYVQYAIPTAYGGKMAQVTVNGVATDIQFNATSAWDKARVGTIKLNEGDNVIEVGGGWSYYRVDSIFLIPAPAPAKPLAVAPTLVNANATKSAQDLMAFLVSSYGTKTISGQTEYMDYNNNKIGLRDFDKIVEITGGAAAPAISAFDFIEYSSSRVACGSKHGTLSEDMIDAHKKKNVILAPLWHWNAPTKLKDTTCTGSGDTAWYSGFYSTATTFDLKAALADTNGADYKGLIKDIDIIAAELKKFSDADIPLLWRPLHEAQGAWFWWGKSGPEELKVLWKLMYDRMTTVHGLNNLIWVFTYSGTADAAWYPGDAYVDIVGYDGYDGKNAANPFKGQFSTIKDRHDGKKLVGLTETGTIPNVKVMQEQNAWWAFFVTWNSAGSSEYGPVNADPAIVKASYTNENTINLKDVPGGRAKVEAGLFDGLEIPTGEWSAQVSWGNTTGLTTSSAWSASGLNTLALTKDMSKETAPSNVVFQVYPVGGVDVADKSKLKISVNSTNSGAGTTAYVFVKYGKDWVWASTSAVAANSATIEIDVSAYDTLAGYGVVFEGFDKTSIAANFYIDKIQLDSAVLYDFEPATSGWETQVSWSPTPGGTLSSAWKNSGMRSLALVKDLSKETAPSNAVFQVYPEGGIDVSAAGKLSVAVNSTDSGSGTTAYLFVKHGKDWVWASTSAVAANAATIEIDVSAYDTLAGFGVVFESFDKTSTAAKFYVDSVKLDSKTLYDFEGTGAWEFQVNWSPAAGIQLATDWTKSGAYSLAGVTQLKSGDDNIILQTYPAGGVLLGKVTKLKISARAKDVGAAAQAQLFAKDKGGNWKDGGAVALVNGSADLTLDVSGWDELSGFGVRFMGPVNSATPSSYYIDDVSFE